MRKASQMLVLAVLTLVTGLTVGCGDSPEKRLNKAQIAWASGYYEEAIKQADRVLADRPGDEAALVVKAKAQISSLHLAGAGATLDTLLRGQPQHLEGHQLQVSLGLQTLRELTNKTAFVTDEALQKRFDEAVAAGQVTAQWFADSGKRPVEANYYRARFHLETGRKATLLIAQRELVMKNQSLPGPLMEQMRAQVAKLNDEKLEAMDKVQTLLRGVVEADPRQGNATDLYISTLTEQKDWGAILALAHKLADQTNLPDLAAQHMVEALIWVPDAQMPPEPRRALAWKVYGTLDSQRVDKSVPAMLAAAQLHLWGGDIPKARNLLETLRAHDPNEKFGLVLLAQAYLRGGDAAKSRDLLEKLVLDPQLSRRHEVQRMYGEALMATGDPKLRPQAKEALQKALDLDRDDVYAMLKKIQLQSLETGRLSDSAQQIKDLYQRSPENPQYIRLMMEYDQSQSLPQEVEKVLARAEELKDKTPDLLVVLIDGYRYIGNLSKAMRYADDLVKAQPDEVNNHLRACELAMAAHVMSPAEIRAALEALREKFKIRFQDASAVDLMMAELYLQQTLYDRAIDTVKPLLAADEKNLGARLVLARAYMGLALADDALAQVKAILALDPINAAAHELAYDIYSGLGQTEEAHKHELQINPEQESVRRNPALTMRIKIGQGKLEEAEAIGLGAITGGNPDTRLRALLAAIYRKMNKPDLAHAQLSSLVNLERNNPNRWAELAGFYLEQKDPARGLLELGTLQPLNEPLARMSQAQLLAAQDPPNLDEAINRLTPVLPGLVRDRSELTFPVARMLALLLVAKKDFAAAAKVYDPLVAADLHPWTARLAQLDLSAQGQEVGEVLARLDELAAALPAPPKEEAVRYQVLMRYVSLRAWDHATRLLDDWAAKRPKEVLLVQWRGDLLMQMGKPREAAAHYKALIDKNPKYLGFRLSYVDACVGANDFPAAATALEELAQLDMGNNTPDMSNKILALTRLGELYMSLGLMRQAAATFDRLEQEAKPNDPRVMLATGQALLALGRTDKAKLRLGQVPRFAEQYVAAQVLLTQVEQNEGKPDEARKRMEELAKDPHTALATPLAVLRSGSGRSSDAYNMIRWAMPDAGVEHLPLLAQQQWWTASFAAADQAQPHDYQGQLKIIDQLEKLRPRDPLLAMSRALVQYALGSPEAAKQAYQENARLVKSPLAPALALVLDLPAPALAASAPADNSAAPPLVAVLVAIGRSDKAAAAAAFKDFKLHQTVYRGDLAATLADADTWTPRGAKAARDLVLAALEFSAGMTSTAVEGFDAVATAEPRNVLAQALTLQARLDGGERGDSTKVRNVLETVRRNLGGTRLAVFVAMIDGINRKDFAAAAAEAGKLQDLEPDNPFLRSRRVDLLQRANNFAEAIKVLDRAYPAVLERVSQAKARYEAATQPAAPLSGVAVAGNELLQATAELAQVSNDLAYLLAENQPQRLEEAAQIAQKAFDLASNLAPLLDTMGWIAHLRGNDPAALDQLARCIPAMRSNPDVQYHIGLVYKALGNKAWARYHLAEVAAGPVDNPVTTKARLELEKGL